MCRTSLYLGLVGLMILVSAVQGQTLGDRLVRTMLIWSSQPLTAADATSQGWHQISDKCDPTSGYAYSSSSSGTSSTQPNVLYYTAAGQLAGFGVRVKGFIPDYLVQTGFWRQADGQYDIFIRTRDPKLLCSGEKAADLVGDRLEINGFFPIGLNTTVAKGLGWTEGNCIPKMGVHWSYDLAGPGKNTWNTSTLVPVQPMYDSQKGTINAVLFNVPHWEWTEPVGPFEGPFPGNVFCWNWCANTGCHFDGVSAWVTMHWWFIDPNPILCTGARCSLIPPSH